MTKSKAKPPAALLSLRAYARHRGELGLTGKTHSAVRKAIDAGRIAKGVVRRGNRDLIDPAVADAEWERRSAPAKRPDAPGAAATNGQGKLWNEQVEADLGAEVEDIGASFQRIKTVGALYQTKLAQLEFERRVGSLCTVAEVQSEAFRIARSVRDKLLQIPARIANDLAELVDVGEILALLEGEVRAACEALSTDEPEVTT